MTTTLDISTLENWLWEAACKIRGPVDAPKYKDYILPLIFLKRLSNVFADEINALGDEYGDPEIAGQLVDADHSLVRFYIPPHARWSYLARLSMVGIGEALTDAVRAVSARSRRPHVEEARCVPSAPAGPCGSSLPEPNGCV